MSRGYNEFTNNCRNEIYFRWFLSQRWVFYFSFFQRECPLWHSSEGHSTPYPRFLQLWTGPFNDNLILHEFWNVWNSVFHVFRLVVQIIVEIIKKKLKREFFAKGWYFRETEKKYQYHFFSKVNWAVWIFYEFPLLLMLS